MDAHPKPLVIIGAGGFGREALDVAEAMNAVAPTWDILGFLDDAPSDLDALGRRVVQVIGGLDLLADLDAEYVIGIGSPATRSRIDDRATALGRRAAVLVHPAATMGADVTLGDGTIVTAGVRLTTNIRGGRHVHLNLSCTVGHDVVLGDHVTVNPGVNVSGNVTIGDGVTLGTGSAVIQGLTIGAGTIVGAGAVVTRDLPAGVTAVGMPARPLDR